MRPHPSPRRPERRRAWLTHADELGMSEAFWRYAPGVPEQLRRIPEPPDPRPLLGKAVAAQAAYHRDADEHRRHLEARIAWLNRGGSDGRGRDRLHSRTRPPRRSPSRHG